jgi:hypothetical protein
MQLQPAPRRLGDEEPAAALDEFRYICLVAGVASVALEPEKHVDAGEIAHRFRGTRLEALLAQERREVFRAAGDAHP